MYEANFPNVEPNVKQNWTVCGDPQPELTAFGEYCFDFACDPQLGTATTTLEGGFCKWEIRHQNRRCAVNVLCMNGGESKLTVWCQTCPECSTDADCPGGYACLDGECVQQPPDPDPCVNGFQQTTTWILPSGGEPLRAQQQQQQFTLRRFANRPEGAVFVEEWALVRNQPQVVSEVRISSTEEFASGIANFTSMLSHAGLPDGEDVLIVQAANHPHNARHVPPPKFVPLKASLTSGWENLIGTYWFRAEISESGKVDHVAVFGADSDRELPDLEAVLQRELRVEFADHSRHRTVVFGFGRATESGRLVADSALTLVPACCCPECMPPVDPGES